MLYVVGCIDASFQSSVGVKAAEFEEKVAVGTGVLNVQ